MTEADTKQEEKDEALQQRREELEDELERYAHAGAFSPGLIKFTKWLSRGLYFAMAAGFAVMLFTGWGKISKDEYERVNDAYTKWKKEAEDQKTAKTKAEGMLADAEIRAAKARLELEHSREDDQVRAADLAQQLAKTLAVVQDAAPDAGRLEAAYRKAEEADRLALLAMYAECSLKDEAGLMRSVATSERPLAEKIIAVRWMGERKDEGSRTLLKTLSEGNDALAGEAKEALTRLGG